MPFKIPYFNWLPFYSSTLYMCINVPGIPGVDFLGGGGMVILFTSFTTTLEGSGLCWNVFILGGL